MPTKLPLNFISKCTIHHKTPSISHYSSRRSSWCRTSGRRSAAPSCSTRSSAESIRWNGRGSENHHHHHHRVPKLSGAGGSINYGGVDQDGDNKMPRVVHCEVQVVSWRERKIKAEISVNADVDSVWDALTDYECLADFVPNLVSSKRIPCPHPGRIWLEQRGLQRALYWHIEAHVVLDLQEFINSENIRELHFSMVDGDFKKFEGKWFLKSGKRASTTMLCYEVNVIPRFNFPAIFLERIIRSDLPVNLQALACRAESKFEGHQNTVAINAGASADSLASLVSSSTEKNKISTGALKEKLGKATFGSVAPATSDLNSNWGVFGKTCKINKTCTVDEVHLRRFDGLLENGGVHRCVVASITVRAPVREVWNVLTSYESLPEIVPNLAISKILSRENNKVRILQRLGYLAHTQAAALARLEKLVQQLFTSQGKQPVQEEVSVTAAQTEGVSTATDIGDHHLCFSSYHKVSALSTASHNHAIALANQAGANTNTPPSTPTNALAAEISFVGTQSHTHLGQQQDFAKVAQNPGALGPSKARVPSKQPPTKTTLSPDSMVKAHSVAAGTCIATPSDVASLLKDGDKLPAWLASTENFPEFSLNVRDGIT